jgi:pimeloyl-ACP methyl ester carboxylesterase
MNVKDTSIVLANITLAAKVWQGNGAGKLLLIHGWMDNCASFDALMPHLNYEQAVCIELAGHGHSQHRSSGCSYQVSDYIIDLMRVIDKLQWHDFTLIGHSMGAMIGAKLALCSSDKIQGLVLLESIGPLSGKPEQEPQRLIDSVQQTLFLENHKAKPMKSLDMAVKLRQRKSDLSYQQAETLVSRSIKKTQDGFEWRHDKRLVIKYPMYPTEEQVIEYLKQITCPTLFLEAENGLLRNRQQVETRKAAISNLDSAQLPGGHHFHMEHPERVAMKINQFLAR